MSVCLAVYLSACMSICLSICLHVCLSIHLPSVCLSVCLSLYCLYVCLPIFLSVSLSVRLFICMFHCLCDPRCLPGFVLHVFHQQSSVGCLLRVPWLHRRNQDRRSSRRSPPHSLQLRLARSRTIRRSTGSQQEDHGDRMETLQETNASRGTI